MERAEVRGSLTRSMATFEERKIKIEQELNAREVEQLAWLAEVDFGSLGPNKAGSFLEKLSQTTKITENNFRVLKRLLEVIGRKDLANDLEEVAETGAQYKADEVTDRENDFRIHLYPIAAELTEAQAMSIRRHLKIRPTRETQKSGVSMFVDLMKNYGNDIPEVIRKLSKALETVERNDLARHLQKYVPSIQSRSPNTLRDERMTIQNGGDGSVTESRKTFQVSKLPKDWHLKSIMYEMEEKCDEKSFERMKKMCTDMGNGGLPKSELQKAEKIEDLFTYLRNERMIDLNNVLLLQALAECVDDEDLKQEVVHYAKITANTLYYCKPDDAKNTNGYEHVQFHVEGNLGTFTKAELEGMRHFVAGVLKVEPKFIFVVGLSESASVILTFLIHEDHAKRLKEIFIKNAEDFARHNIDGVHIGIADPLDLTQFTMSEAFHSKHDISDTELGATGVSLDAEHTNQRSETEPGLSTYQTEEAESYATNQSKFKAAEGNIHNDTMEAISRINERLETRSGDSSPDFPFDALSQRCDDLLLRVERAGDSTGRLDYLRSEVMATKQAVERGRGVQKDGVDFGEIETTDDSKQTEIEKSSKKLLALRDQKLSEVEDITRQLEALAVGQQTSGEDSKYGEKAKQKGTREELDLDLGHCELYEAETRSGVVVIREKEFECNVCWNFLCDPVELPCLHMFCRGCILTILTNKQVGEAQCPMCRKLYRETDLKPASFLVQRLLSMLPSQDDEHKATKCEAEQGQSTDTTKETQSHRSHLLWIASELSDRETEALAWLAGCYYYREDAITLLHQFGERNLITVGNCTYLRRLLEIIDRKDLAAYIPPRSGAADQYEEIPEIRICLYNIGKVLRDVDIRNLRFLLDFPPSAARGENVISLLQNLMLKYAGDEYKIIRELSDALRSIERLDLVMKLQKFLQFDTDVKDDDDLTGSQK